MKEYLETGDEEFLKKATGQRELPPELVAFYEERRRKSKNTQHSLDIGHGNLLATSESSATPEKKEKAADAFLFSPGTVIRPEDRFKITGLDPIKSTEPMVIDDEEIEEPKWFGWSGDSMYLFGM